MYVKVYKLTIRLAALAYNEVERHRRLRLNVALGSILVVVGYECMYSWQLPLVDTPHTSSSSSFACFGLQLHAQFI